MSVNLTTRYMGLKLKNPIVVSACPLAGDLTMLQRLESAGAAAAVLPSLFEEQIERDSLRWQPDIAKTNEESDETSATSDQSIRYFPDMANYNTDPDGYLRQVELTKKTVSIPVIGSLNGSTEGGWVRFATLIEQAGADALELNVFIFPTDIETTTQEIEDRYVEIVNSVSQSISIPLSVKIGPYFAALPNFAKRLVDAGADGLVLFNRFLEPEFDVGEFAVRPRLQLSDSREIRLPLRWIAILYRQLDVSLAATSGIHDAIDIIKTLAAGADIAMIASALILGGPNKMHDLVNELQQWLENHEFGSVEQIKGVLSRETYHEPTAFERANYMETIASYNKIFK